MGCSSRKPARTFYLPNISDNTNWIFEVKSQCKRIAADSGGYTGMSRSNVVRITIHCVRADHTPLNGFRRDTTLDFSNIASRGNGFTKSITRSISTQPLIGAIFTGRAPTRMTVGLTESELQEDVLNVLHRPAIAGNEMTTLSCNLDTGGDQGLVHGIERFQWISSPTLPQVDPWILVDKGRNFVQPVSVIWITFDMARADTSGMLGVNSANNGHPHAISQRCPRDFRKRQRRNSECDTSKLHIGMLNVIRTNDNKFPRSKVQTKLFNRCDQQDYRERTRIIARIIDKILIEWLDEHGKPIDQGYRGEFSAPANHQQRNNRYID